MTVDGTTSGIVPPEALDLEDLPGLGPEDSFSFACHPGVECFNACCADLDLVLTPYDVLRLRRALALPAKAFFMRYAELLFEPGSGLPLARVRMEDDGERRCPFLRADGCGVYADRPAPCRMYPLARGVSFVSDGVQEHFVIVQEEHCRGFDATPSWTPRAWMAAQGLTPYNECNDDYSRLMARCAERGVTPPPDRLGLVVLATFQLDTFREMILRAPLFERFAGFAARREQATSSEEEALRFGLDWLALTLGIAGEEEGAQ